MYSRLQSSKHSSWCKKSSIAPRTRIERTIKKSRSRHAYCSRLIYIQEQTIHRWWTSQTIPKINGAWNSKSSTFLGLTNVCGLLWTYDKVERQRLLRMFGMRLVRCLSKVASNPRCHLPEQQHSRSCIKSRLWFIFGRQPSSISLFIQLHDVASWLTSLCYTSQLR